MPAGESRQGEPARVWAALGARWSPAGVRGPKTRHQNPPSETGSRRGASVANFRTRRPASIIVIFLVRSQQVAKMPLAEDNDMVKTIPSDRTDEPLRMSVLPWRSWCDRPVPNAHRANPTDKDIAIDTIPIANDILRRLLPAVCLGELTRNPLAARMRGHAQPQNPTAGMPQDQKSIQQPERDRGDHEQIHRRDAVRVISKKRLPSLGRRTPSSRHVLGNGGLPDIDAELEQFAMNPAPQSGFSILMSRMS